MSADDVQVAQTDDHAQVAAVLAEAFDADPVMAWMIPKDRMTDEDRLQFWQHVCAGRTPNAMMQLTAGGDAAALWFRPVDLDAEAERGDDEPSLEDEANESMSAIGELFFSKLGDEEAMNRFAFFEKMSGGHPAEPHWYLQSIGTRVAAQGRGRGAALLAPVLAECDEQGLLCYLESSNPRNLPFYFRHGFEATGELLTGDDAAVMTFMIRQPR